jgi:hypothetical protein
MNRILTDLRNRLTTEHLEQLMRISIEGPSDLDNDLKDLIVFFSVFFYIVLLTEEV